MKSNRIYNSATARTLYLDQSGYRVVSIDRNGNRETLPVSLDGVSVKPRSLVCWQACGNFSYPIIRVKGRQVTVYPDSEVSPTKWMPYSVKYAA